MQIKFFIEWTHATKNFLGLPRPFARYGGKYPNPKKLAIKSPIPWQSIPVVSSGRIALETDNEEKVWKENRCPYCGVVFVENDEAIRWTTLDTPLSKKGQRVFSDLHPFHLECMRQARIFCPHMKTTTDTEFEIGPYSQMRANAHAQISSHNR